jgi:hypothetical protein
MSVSNLNIPHCYSFYDLINHGVSDSSGRPVASNSRIINDRHIGSDFEAKARNFSGGTEENSKYLSG